MGTLGKTWKCSKMTCRRRSKALKKYFAKNPGCHSGENNSFYGKIHSDAAKEKNRVAHLGKKQSRETIEKRVRTIRERNNGVWHQKGFRHSEESKKKMSESNKGHIAWNKGIAWSDDVKEKLSKAHSGKVLSDKHKERISKGLAKAYQENRRKESHRRFITGYFYSKKNGKEFSYRSSYEWYAYKLLEQMSMVFSYEVEPFSIKYMNGYNRVSRYIPDILVTYMDGSKQLIEIKPKRQIEDRDVQKKIRAGEKYCKLNGMEFVVWTEKEVYKHKILKEPIVVQ